MRKRNRGQALDINANDWNRVCDLANPKIGQSAGNGATRDPNKVWIKNTLGRDLSRFAAVCIGFPTPIELHTGRNDQVYQLINGSVQGRFTGYSGGELVIGVLPEPIASNRIGLAQIDGVIPAQFRHSELNGPGGIGPPEFATISDLDDMLVPAQFGSVRVLHRNISASGTWTSDKSWWVQLGSSAPSLGSIRLRGQFDGNPANNIWNELIGDRRALGFYSEDGEVGSYPAAQNLKLCRPGRYHVVVRYLVSPNAPGGGYATGDRVEWRASWADGGSWYQHYVHGTGTPSAWSEAVQCVGERTFHLAVNDLATPSTIPMPTIEAKRIPFSGSAATSLTLASGGKIEVEAIHLGARAYTTFWSKTLKDAAFGRGSSAGPI